MNEIDTTDPTTHHVSISFSSMRNVLVELFRELQEFAVSSAVGKPITLVAVSLTVAVVVIVGVALGSVSREWLFEDVLVSSRVLR